MRMTIALQIIMGFAMACRLHAESLNSVQTEAERAAGRDTEKEWDQAILPMFRSREAKNTQFGHFKVGNVWHCPQ